MIPRSKLVGMPGYIGDGQAWSCSLEGEKFPEPVQCWVFGRVGSQVPHGVIEIVADEGLVETYGMAHGGAVRIRLMV